MTELGLGAVRQWHIDALARRAALHQGAVRRVLDDKLQRLRSAQMAQQAQLAQGLALAPAQAPIEGLAQASPAQQPLAELLAHMARHTQAAQPPDVTMSAPLGAPNASAPMELKAIRNYRSTWSRLRAERRLHQALALVPHNAGPLNTQRLLHQALHVMQRASPGYLLHFMAHVESLLALDLVNQPLHPLPTAKAGDPRPKRGG